MSTTLASYERVLYLRRIPALAELDDGELARLAANSRERFFRRGELLLEEGRPIEAIHTLVEGRVEVTRGGRPLIDLEPPGGVGRMGFFAGVENGVDARAATDVMTLELSADAWLELAEDDPNILLSVLKRTAELLVERYDLSPNCLAPPHDEAEPLTCPARRLDLVERLFFLRRNETFELSSLSGLAEFARGLDEVRLAPGEVLWEPGDEADSFIIVICGDLHLEVPGHDSLRYYAGGSVGAAEALAGRPRWYRASVGDGMVALRTSVDHLLDVAEDEFEFGLGLLRRLSARLLRLHEMAAEQGHGAMEAML